MSIKITSSMLNALSAPGETGPVRLKLRWKFRLPLISGVFIFRDKPLPTLFWRVSRFLTGESDEAKSTAIFPFKSLKTHTYFLKFYLNLVGMIE